MVANHIILEVCWGPLASSKAVLAPGQVLRVGRGDTAELAVPHDESMSELHFELAWDGSICRLRDLKSSSGTQVNGQPVEQAEIFHGTWVRAGTTDLLVYFEGATPPGRQVPVEPEPATWVASKLRLLELLKAQSEPLYAVLDAARGERIRVLLRESIEVYRSL